MTYLGVGLLVCALALLFVFRATPSGEPHRLVSGPVISALFPTLVLGLITFSVAILISQRFH